MNRRCSDCTFFDALVRYEGGEEDQGTCRRRCHPWPERKGSDWCGEYESREVPDAPPPGLDLPQEWGPHGD